jgi:mono/diheme cytochrome c family protein
MTDSRATAAERRENPEPEEGTRPVPWSVVILTECLVVLCVVYIGYANVDTPSEWGDGRSRLELAGGPPTAGATKVDGAAVFASSCAGCHQATGAGLPGVFPPLAGSEWVLGKDGTAAAIVLQGVTGDLTVNGTTYKGAMPAFKAQLSDDQVAAVLSHVRSQWGNGAAVVNAATIAKVRSGLGSRTEPFAGGKELEALP